MASVAILNADMAELRRKLRAGLRWWLGELGALVPERLRARDDTARLLAPAEGQGWHLQRAGEVVPAGRGDNARATIVAPDGSVLERVVQMPALPAADLHRMLALDLDRLAPLHPADATFDWSIRSRDPARGRVEVVLGVMRLEEARLLRDAAVALGYRPHRIAAAAPDGRLRFDFLRGFAGPAPGAAQRGRWWGVVAALFALNVAILVGRDIAGTNRLEDVVDAAAPTARAARALAARAAMERRQLAGALLAHDRHEPLRVIAAATAVLPAGAWSQRFAWDGSVVRIAGYKDRGLDVLAALRRSPAFRDVRESGGDGASQASAAQPYDVSARVVPLR